MKKIVLLSFIVGSSLVAESQKIELINNSHRPLTEVSFVTTRGQEHTFKNVPAGQTISHTLDNECSDSIWWALPGDTGPNKRGHFLNAPGCTETIFQIDNNGNLMRKMGENNFLTAY